MPFTIIRNDITKVNADAIVNTANPRPVIGSGTDSAVYKAAGEKLLLEARQKIGNIAPGQAEYTDAFQLNAKYIIHTVGPAWTDGEHGEREILHDCYENSLKKAAELSCESIAFPLIATGVYGFPKDEALQIALYEINRFLLSHDMKVILVVFDGKSFELSEKLVGDIEEYIDEHSAKEISEIEYCVTNLYSRRMSSAEYAEQKKMTADADDASGEADDENEWEELPETDTVFSESAVPALPDVSGRSLDEILENTGDTFQQRLFQLIDESGMDDVTVYKKANIDRKVFSRIRCRKDYRPKKKTAVAFAIALQLDMPTMLDLLSRAEIAFSPSSKFDLIISYFITNKIYDIFEINAALFKYGQPILGE